MNRNTPKTSPMQKPFFFSILTIVFCIVIQYPESASAAAVAGITSPVNGYSTAAGSTVTFVGSAAGVTGTPTYQWISSLDGSLGSTLILSVATLSIGSHTISFIITDDNGPSNVPSITVNITNTSPVATISNPATGASFALGAAVSLQGTGTDAEDGNLSGTAIRWSSSLNGSLGTGSPLSVSTLSAGTHTITLTATDSNNATDTDTISITVNPNASPTAAISNPANNSSVASGTYISFQGSGSDTEDGPLASAALSWSSSIDGVIGTGSPLSINSLSVGVHTIILTVKDSKNATGTASITLTITNTAPIAAIANPANNSSVASGTYVSFQGSGTDAEDGLLGSSALSWSSSIEGTIGSGSPLSLNSLSVGMHTITLTVTDSKNSTGSTSITLTITNTNPTATITSPANNSTFTTKDYITFLGAGTDAEDGTLANSTLSWSSSRDGQLGTGSPMTLDTLTAGTHTITLTVTDKDGSTGTTTAGITVTNASPSVLITTPVNETSFDQGETIVFNSTVTDAEDGILSGSALVWTSSKDGQIGTGTSFSTSTLSKGTHTITLTAKDSDDATGTYTITITAGNTAPTATITLPADGSAFATGATITFNGIGTDLESAVTYAWISNIDGALSTSSYFLSTSIPNGLSKGKHLITLTVTDADNTSTSTSVNITTGNAPPTATINNPASGATYKEGEDIYFNGTGSDTEDGTLTGVNLVWTSNRNGLLSPIGTGVSFSTGELKYGTHTIYLTATDNDNASTQSSAITLFITQMTVSPAGLSVYENQSGTLTVSGGTAPYKVSNRYTQVAAAEINKTTGVVTVTGLKEGSTIIVIADANRMTTSANVAVMALPDTDKDGTPDISDAFPDNPAEWLDTDSDGKGNNTDTDDDNDGMPDEWENLYGLNPLSNDASQDLDGDGITNLEEYYAGTDPSNSAPERPELYLPVNTSQVLTITPVLKTYEFSDVDPEDTHMKTRWQVSTDSSFSNIVTDITSKTELTTFNILDHIISTPAVEDSIQLYYWRVKFFDNHDGESQWSAPFYFYTTIKSDTSDSANGNGIPDSQEVDNFVDLDKNGIADNLQSDIKTIQILTAEGLKKVALKISTNVTAIQGFKSITTVPDLENAPEDLPFGLITFKIQLYKSGEVARMNLYLSEKAPEWSRWFKYDPENGWENFSEYMELSKDGHSVTLYLKDGGYGDADGIENGIIVDPSGLSITSPEDLPDNDGGSGCFIESMLSSCI